MSKNNRIQAKIRDGFIRQSIEIAIKIAILHLLSAYGAEVPKIKDLPFYSDTPIEEFIDKDEKQSCSDMDSEISR